MTAADVIVIVLGVALIAGELWFFLGPRRTAERVESEAQTQEIRIVVRDGYDPDMILVEAGQPVRLLFSREETSECSERVGFETLGIERDLPAFETTAVDLPPLAPGDYPFRCGKGV
ncbi:MAG: cupredoxin domain-containing protein, partial [Gemmatimonadales bacterium]|nr:cupredoxin domain-containing protein [Gemmatimonadales bacterium]